MATDATKLLPQKIIVQDTFPDFLKFWDKTARMDTPQKIEAWEVESMASSRELFQLQIQDYAGQGEDWRQVAAEKVFPFIDERLSEMHAAHDNILAQFKPICMAAIKEMGFDHDLSGLIHVGIGCGAGWVTVYQGNQTILFGLEDIAELHWGRAEAIRGLIAHEIGHVIQATWRSELGLNDDGDSWWQLFNEGFAQYCEQLILGQNSWHMAATSNHDWLAWCWANKSGLAARFLEDAYKGKDIRPFFGSWYDIDGHSQCGYYLGYEAIQSLSSRGMDLKEIPLLEDPKSLLGEILRNFASDDLIK